MRQFTPPTIYNLIVIVNSISFEIHCVHTCLDNLPNLHEVVLDLNIKKEIYSTLLLKSLVVFFFFLNLFYHILSLNACLVMCISREFRIG